LSFFTGKRVSKSNAYLFLKRLSRRLTSECYCLSAEVSTVMYCALHLCINRYFYVYCGSFVIGIVLRYPTNTSSQRERQESNYSGQLPFHTPFELYKNNDEVTSIHESNISIQKLCETPGMITTYTLFPTFQWKPTTLFYLEKWQNVEV